MELLYHCIEVTHNISQSGYANGMDVLMQILLHVLIPSSIVKYIRLCVETWHS